MRTLLIVAAVLMAGCSDAPTIDPAIAELAEDARADLMEAAGEDGDIQKVTTTMDATMRVRANDETMELDMQMESTVTYFVDGLLTVVEMDMAMPEEAGGDVRGSTRILCNGDGMVVEVAVDGEEPQRFEEDVEGSCFDVDAMAAASQFSGSDMGFGNMMSWITDMDPESIRVTATRGDLDDAHATQEFDVDLPILSMQIGMAGTMVSHIVDGKIVSWTVDADISLSGDMGIDMDGSMQGTSTIVYAARAPAPADL